MAKLVFTPNPKIRLETEAPNEVELFRRLARMQEVFGEGTCGLCNSTDIRYQAYKVKSRDGGEFWNHVLHCDNCEGCLRFGQHKVGNTLYAKRDGNPTKRGWIPKTSQTAPNTKPAPTAKTTTVTTPATDIQPATDEEWNIPNLEETNVPF